MSPTYLPAFKVKPGSAPFAKVGHFVELNEVRVDRRAPLRVPGINFGYWPERAQRKVLSTAVRKLPFPRELRDSKN
jgi:hypothetical protein